MDSYSHGAFTVAGYMVTGISRATMVHDIQTAWGTFMKDKMGDVVVGKAYPHLHTLYYNFVDPTGPSLAYDMLIGYAVHDGTIQSDPRITTVVVPAQNYKYKKYTGNPRELLPGAWSEINAMPKEDVKRTYAYDMEMFSEDGNEVTVAVAVE
jgi:predicted transcriptional regulator YdeE